MKSVEFLSEAYIHPDINNIMKKKGYKYLDAGADQTVYVAPDGMILKIFGTNTNSKDGSLELTTAQKTFKAFADYCNAHSNNPFLPKFSDWNMFEYKGKPYLQIKMERLFPFKGGASGIEDVLEEIAEDAEQTKDPKVKEKFILSYTGEYDDPSKWHLGHSASKKSIDEFQRLIGLIGEDGFHLLWDTIYDLGQVARKIGLSNLDLHGGNFMLNSDGHIVISDPFFAGHDN